MKVRRRRRIDATIDMTPMIDTLLQLFVVFLLSMSFVASAVRLDLPQASLQPKQADAPVAVSIDAAGNWFVNNEAVARDQLRFRLEAHFAQGNKREVLLRADRTLLYEKILEVMGEIQRSGASNIMLAYDQNAGPGG